MTGVADKLELVPMLGRVAAGVARDRLGLTPRPTSLDDVPASGDALTTEWLTRALCRDVDGAAVIDFEIVGGSDGTSSRRSLRISYNEAGMTAGLPERVFTKSSANLGSRILLGLTGIVSGETTFFNDLRPRVDLRSPKGYFAASDPRSCRSIVMLEDLSVRGWSFPDPMQDRVTEDDAREMVDQMAAYHAAFWNGGAAPGSLGRMASSLLFQERLNRRAMFSRRFHVGLDRSLDKLPASLQSRRDEIWPAFMRSLELNVQGPQTLLHQDLHQGNWLRDPEGLMGLYDWQCVARGGWALDVAYALVATLATEDRRAWERDLFERYADALRERGVPDAPDTDTAWLDYRRQPLHAFVFGVFTNGQPRFAPELQPRDYTLRSIERIGAAVDDLGTLDLLGQAST
jgi:hypothetical protein